MRPIYFNSVHIAEIQATHRRCRTVQEFPETRPRNFIAAFGFRTKLKKAFFVLTKLVQRSKVWNALQPRSPWSSPIGTQGRPGMTRFHNVGSLLQPVPQARGIRIPLQVLTPNELRPAPVRTPPYGGRKIDVTAGRREA
jgi:hypothetical protein